MARRVAVAVVAVVAVVATMSLGGLRGASAEPEGPAGPDAPGASDAPDATESLAALLARVDAVAREVAKVRGLPLKRRVASEVVGRDELRARLLKLAADEKTTAEAAAEGFALERWGLIPRGMDYKAMLVDVLTEQIAGYYDAETKKLTISQAAGNDPAWAEMVLAHELDHALQDQAFDLRRFEDVPDTEGDAAAARRALVEGDGIALMIEVMVGRARAKLDWANPEIARTIEHSMAGGGGGDLDRAPLAIREAMLFPYRAGFGFVAALRRRQPWTAVDAAYARPPRSTEQILHPELYLADERPIAIEARVPAALPGFAVVHDTVWGELGFSLWLRSHGITAPTAAVAAAGWGGDRAIVVARPDDPRPAHGVAIARFAWDTEADAIEAAEAAGKALAAAVVGRIVDRTPTRMQLFALDGTVSFLERRAASLVVILGAPAWSAAALATEAWTATSLARPARARR